MGQGRGDVGIPGSEFGVATATMPPNKLFLLIERAVFPNFEFGNYK
jgi:hypothetical protein